MRKKHNQGGKAKAWCCVPCSCPKRDESGVVFAQISRLRPEEVGWKLDALRRLWAGGAHLLFFCDCDHPVDEQGVRFVPLTTVERWLAGNPEISLMLQPTLTDVDEKCE